MNKSIPDANFALQWLDYLGNEIYSNGKKIFTYDGKPNYVISRLNTKVEIGKPIAEEYSPGYKNISFSELQEMNYSIVPRYTGGYTFYELVRSGINTPGINQTSFTRLNMLIRHDPENRRIRLVGDYALPENKRKFGMGRWVIYDRDESVNYYATKGREDGYYDSVKTWMAGNEDTQPRYQIIHNDIPILISDEKYIVCLRKIGTCQRMIVVGESGFGKSTMVNAISTRIFYTWEDRIGWMLDPLNQFNDISLPQDYIEFNRLNNYIFNEPRPLPAVQLYLACKKKVAMKHPEISMMIALNFFEFLKRYKFYVFGLKEMDIGDTYRYMMDFIKDIKDVNDKDDIKDIMFERIPNAHKDKGMQSMIYKWVNTFDTILKERFTSNMYEKGEVCDELEVKFADGSTMKGHPYLMCMEAGVVPILNTAAARRERWVRNYLADIMQKTVAHQIDTPENKRHRMWQIADEMNEIYEFGKRKDNASAAFEELYRQGRFNNIGFIGNTQSLRKLSQDMFENATHICCVYMKDRKSRSMIESTYEMKDIGNRIEELKKQEMIVFSKEPFIIYDRWGRRELSNKKWFKGRILPPMNYHKVPGGG